MVRQRGLPGSPCPQARAGAAHGPAGSPRRSRRGDVARYQVRIDLAGTEPALWRRLELASDLFLDQVHDIIQVAFGWNDSHLHCFSSDPDRHGGQAERYLCPFDVDEGNVGISEAHVRLDEDVPGSGARFLYR